MTKRIFLAILILAGVLLPWAHGGRYELHIATMVAIMAMLALSMNLMLRIGQLSMAHGAFMGMGAYMSALLTMRLGIPPVLSALMACVITGLIAALLGTVFLRIKGIYFVLLTYALGEIINLIFQEWVSLFGGNNGLYGIPKLSLFGYRLTDPGAYYLLTVIAAFATFLLTRAVFRSSIGDILDSLDQDEPLSQSLGVNPLSWRIGVFGTSAALASIAGSLYAFRIGFLSPDAFGFDVSVDLVVMNVVGGALSPLGPMLGALIIVPLPELLRGVKEYQLLSYGVILLIFLMFFRDGVIGVIKNPRRTAA